MEPPGLRAPQVVVRQRAPLAVELVRRVRMELVLLARIVQEARAVMGVPGITEAAVLAARAPAAQVEAMVHPTRMAAVVVVVATREPGVLLVSRVPAVEVLGTMSTSLESMAQLARSALPTRPAHPA
jgi:hypothetical protein